ncbi:MAG: hypothetical protein NZ898_14090 [Myxococcota bacterium]|nr:hypothetical protein [Myxococcota bacterium]MDW8362676.1 hypothetical protein [Myxococcales bacterium]
MTLLHVAQIALALLLAALCLERARVLLYRGPIGDERWWRALEEALGDAEPERVEFLVRAVRPAAAADVVAAALGGDALQAREAALEVVRGAFARLRVLVVLSRVAALGGMFCAAVEIVASWHGERSLTALMAGRHEAIVASRALASLAIGACTSIAVLSTVRRLAAVAVRLTAEVRRAEALVRGSRGPSDTHQR